MGCFNFVSSWLVKRKEKRREKKRRRKQGLASSDVRSPRSQCGEEGSKKMDIKRETKGGVAFNVGFDQKPKIAKLPPPRPVKSLVQNDHQRQLMADIRRREARLKKGEAAREADRKKTECAEKRVECEQQFIDKAKAKMESKPAFLDKEVVKINQRKLDRRCKTARMRRQITDLVKMGNRKPDYSKSDESKPDNGKSDESKSDESKRAVEGAAASPDN